MSESDEFYFRIQDEAVKATLTQIQSIAQVFRNPLYDLKKTVESDIDFILGGVFGQIIGNAGCLLMLRSVLRPSPEQEVKLNYRLFSKAPEFKSKVQEALRTQF
jgi:hypothetical protein